jgi:recombination protein RecR
MLQFSSKHIEDAVNAFAKLPGIGKKTALRLVLHLLKSDDQITHQLAESLIKLKTDTQLCKDCHHISDDELCTICANRSRHNGQLCIVENMRDVFSIESTQQYNGLFHVLGGLLSPLDGIGPEQLHISDILTRIQNDEIKEVIMALSPTIEGDTTVYFISKMLEAVPELQITCIARGISFGGDLEYVDEMTLARSIAKRLPVENYITIKD